MYTQFTIFIIKRKSPQIIPNLQLWDVFLETQERVRNTHGKRAISVRANEVLLYFSQIVTRRNGAFCNRIRIDVNKLSHIIEPLRGGISALLFPENNVGVYPAPLQCFLVLPKIFFFLLLP